ncbi:hypothetical protein BGX30_012212 [Mortierella sp. GBA39]|nr:hypothetical protein BGX30_012212 [Mortierella sp. GBA39]
MTMLRLQKLQYGSLLTKRLAILQQRLAISQATGSNVFQQTGDTLSSAGRGRGGQTRLMSEALQPEESEAVEVVAKETVSRRKKAEPSEDTVAATEAPKARKSRTKKAAVKDDDSGGAVETVVKTKKKKKSTKDKETLEAAVVEDKAAAGSGGQAAVVATKVKRVSKSKRNASTLDTSTETITPASPVDTTQLRPYQQECIDTCLENLKKGIMRQIVSLPVGSGKTVVFSHMMKQVPAPFPGANKTLILAHRQELLEQTRNHVLKNGTGLAHHAAAASYGRILEHFGADVPKTHIFVYGCSATVRRHDGLKLGEVFDHISFHKGFVTMIEDKWLCGLRVSTIKTEFDLKDVKLKAGDFATKELSQKVNTPVRNDIIVRSYMTYCGKKRKSTVVFAVDIAHLESLTKIFQQYGYDARGLSSKTNDNDRAQMLKDFKKQKFPVIVNCGILTEGTDIPVIDSIIMARPTKSNVLFQQMLGRGMRLHKGKEDCLVLDFVDVIQGDGLVTLPTLLGLEPGSVLNKEIKITGHQDVDAIRADQIATLEEQVLASSEFPDETETVEEIDPSTGLKVAMIRVLEYDNPYQLIGDCSGANKRVAGMSRNAWVNIGAGAYVLTCKEIAFRIEKSGKDKLYRCYKRVTMDKRHVDENDESLSEAQRLKQDRDQYNNPRWNKESKSKDGGQVGMFRTKETELPIQSETLEDCFHGVDTWISKNVGHMPGMLSRYARWRKLPASSSQLKYLRKLGYDHDPIDDIGGGEDSSDESSDESGDEGGHGDRKDGNSLAKELEMKHRKRQEAAARVLTKGQAANMITRLVHGAGKRWTESKKFEVKKTKALAKEIDVEVGPIPKFVEI